MYTLSRMETKRKPISILIILIVATSISIFSIILAVKATLNFTSLYKFDVNYLKLDVETNMSKDDILNNYTTLINYLNGPSSVLKFPSLIMSEPGKIHFEEVKTIFVNLNYLMYISLFIGIVGAIYFIVKRNFLFLKWSSIALISLPALLFLPFLINFDASFIAFHKIAFTNDYWIFDPIKDPVINILPQAFFFHCAILILSLITIESVIFFVCWKKLKR